MCYIEVGYACIETLLMGNTGKIWLYLRAKHKHKWHFHIDFCGRIILYFLNPFFTAVCPYVSKLIIALFQVVARLHKGDKS